MTEDQRLIHPKPGDTIVITVPAGMNAERRFHVRDQLIATFPENDVLVLTDDVRLGGNRWAAFTNDELDEMYGWPPGKLDDGYSPFSQQVGDEIHDELERRRA